jgi:(p)ppGpp synthase/HD superfamily hydrolase
MRLPSSLGFDIETAEIPGAKRLAREAHESIGQMRKFGGRPYYTHPHAVFDMVWERTANPTISAAAALHDVLEDVFPKNPAFGHDWIVNNFSGKVLCLVLEVTNVFTAKAFPNLSKYERKQLEIQRLTHISDAAKIIKRADLAHNATEIELAPMEFQERWLAEKRQLDAVLGKW